MKTLLSFPGLAQGSSEIPFFFHPDWNSEEGGGGGILGVARCSSAPGSVTAIHAVPTSVLNFYQVEFFKTNPSSSALT